MPATTVRHATRLLAAALVFLAFVPVAEAIVDLRHSAGYVSELARAYEACEAPNDMSSDGVPACSPPVTSACDFSKGDVALRYSGNDGSVRVEVSLEDVSGPTSCTSGAYRIGGRLENRRDKRRG